MAELKDVVTSIDQENVGQINQAFYDLHPQLLTSRNGEVSKTTSVHRDHKTNNNRTADPDLEIAKESMSKFQIIRNLLVISFGFLFLFTAFQSLSNLQSSVNQNLGTLSLSAIYAGLVFSCMFVPSYMIGLLGLKCTVVVSMLMYNLFFVANFYPRWYTLIPASVILGMAAAPLWTAKCSYLTIVATRYAAHVGQPSETYVSRFFGVFFLIFQTSQIWGNLISYKILTPPDGDLEVNLISSNLSRYCGAAYCDSNQGKNDSSYDQGSPVPANFTLLCGVYTGCALAAAVIVVFLLNPLDKKTVKTIEKPSLATLMNTLRHMKHPYQILLIPVTVFSGLTQAYILGDFTKDFVTCAWGVNYVGYVMICFGVTNAVFSLAFGVQMKSSFIRAFIILFGGAIVTSAMIILMFFWVPSGDNRVLYFVISGLWGVGDAVWGTYVNAFYGVLFPDNKEAAFSNFRLWQSVGYIASFAYSSYLCTPVKLAILSCVLILSVIGYLAIEIHLRLTRNRLLRSSSSTVRNETLTDCKT